MPHVLTIIGSANVDMIMQVPHLPAPGETVTGGTFQQVFGGKGANQAVAAARAAAGVSCSFIACVGRDVFAGPMLAGFSADGLDTSPVIQDDFAPTGTALITIDAAAENCIAVAPGANYRLLPEHIEARRELIARSSMLVLQMEIPLATTRRIIEIAGECGTPVLLNYAPMVSRELELDARVHYLVVNETEAQQLSGWAAGTVAEAAGAAKQLRLRGHRAVIVTLGAQGAVVADEGGERHIPALPAVPVDTTAAGDTFCGALAVALVEGSPLDDAMRFASAAAAIAVSRLGAQPSIPWRAEIESLRRQRSAGG
jgi:ribokinase